MYRTGECLYLTELQRLTKRKKQIMKQTKTPFNIQHVTQRPWVFVPFKGDSRYGDIKALDNNRATVAKGMEANDAMIACECVNAYDALKAKADMFDELVEVCDELMIKAKHLTGDLQSANAPISIFTGNMNYIEIKQKIKEAKELTE